MAIFINLLTYTRIILAFVIYILISFYNSYLLALIMFLLAGLTEYVDGFLARKYSLTSSIGEILDPIADKILIVFLFFALALNLSSYLIGFFASIIIAREIWVSALRDFNSKNNNSNATKVTYLAKIKTSMQLFTILFYLIALAFNKMLLIVIGDIFLIVTALITVYTGYIYTIATFKK